MKYKITVESITDNNVVLRYDQHELILPKLFFDEKIVIGSVWYIGISQNKDDHPDEKQLAKDILNEILNSNES